MEYAWFSVSNMLRVMKLYRTYDEGFVVTPSTLIDHQASFSLRGWMPHMKGLVTGSGTGWRGSIYSVF
jgi:hypothetical protein